MLQAGKVERVLVFGILVIIGLILVVAIRGARDVEKEFESQVSALDRDPAAEVPESPRPQSPRLRNGVDSQLQEEIQRSTNSWERNPGNRRNQRPGGEGQPSGNQGAAGERAPAGRQGRGLNNPGTLDRGKPGPETTQPPVSTDGPIVFRPNARNQGTQPAEPRQRPPQQPKPQDRDPGQLRSPEPVTTTPAQLTYMVQKGDTMEGISLALYGKRSMWKEILEVNPKVSDPARIRPDMELLLPRAPQDGAEHLVKAVGASTVTPSNRVNRQPARNERSLKGGGFQRLVNVDTHTVQRGDTLMNIAQEVYGTKAAWRLIYESNADQLNDKNQIRIGQVLKLPASGP